MDAPRGDGAAGVFRHGDLNDPHWLVSQFSDPAVSRHNVAMPPPLTPRERAHLKARAHALDPVVIVGHAGVTPEIVAEVERALMAHELIKVRVGGDDREQRVAIGEQLAEATAAAVVHRVGKVLILWRARPIDPASTPSTRHS